MAANQFVPFGLAPGPGYIQAPAVWAGNAVRLTGVPPGIMPKENFNTPMRQASSIATMVAQFIADFQPGDVLDNGNLAALEAQFLAALNNAIAGAGAGIIVSLSGATGQIKFPASLGGLIIKWGPTPIYPVDSVNAFVFPATGAGPTALPGAFPVACFGAVVTSITNNGVSGVTTNYAVACNTFAVNGMTIINDAAATSVFYIAIGR